MRLFFLLALIALFTLGLVYSEEIGEFLGEDGPVDNLLAQLGWWGPVLFVAIFVVMTVLLVAPPSLLGARHYSYSGLWRPLSTAMAGYPPFDT